MVDKAATDLVAFLDASPSPFHAVAELRRRLESSGFEELREEDRWETRPGDKRFVIRQGSSIAAFVLGREPGFRMVGAHTDSPCLKIKANFPVYKNNYMQI